METKDTGHTASPPWAAISVKASLSPRVVEWLDRHVLALGGTRSERLRAIVNAEYVRSTEADDVAGR